MCLDCCEVCYYFGFVVGSVVFEQVFVAFGRFEGCRGLVGVLIWWLYVVVGVE